MSERRRCALPGCYVVIETTADGGPQRKYCTAAHRAIARQLRREGTNRSASAPPLMSPELPLPPSAADPQSCPAPPSAQFTEPTGRRARAMAVLGSAGLLVAGGTIALSHAPAEHPPTSTAPWLAADPEAEQHWAADAQVRLASLDQQLEEVEAAERSWNAQSPKVRGREVPPDVRALGERKTLLQRQRAEIANQLAGYESMREASKSLADTERHVANLDRALAETPVERAPTAAGAQRIRQLREERGTSEKKRVAQRQRLDQLRDRVRDAMTTPPPASEGATRSITSAVRDLIKNPGAGRSPSHGGHPEAAESDAGRDRRPSILAVPPSIGGGLLDSAPDLPGAAPRLPDVVPRLPSAVPHGPPPGAVGGPTAKAAPPRGVAGRPRQDRLPSPAIRLPGPATHLPDSAAHLPGRITTPKTEAGLPGAVTDAVPDIGTGSRSRGRSAGSAPPTRSSRGTDVRFDGPDADRAAAAYRAAESAIEALPFDDGVKKMARAAVADEIRARQRRGKLRSELPSAEPRRSSANRRHSPGGDETSRSYPGGRDADNGGYRGGQYNGPGKSTAKRYDSGGKKGSEFVYRSGGGSSMGSSAMTRSWSSSLAGPPTESRARSHSVRPRTSHGIDRTREHYRSRYFRAGGKGSSAQSHRSDGSSGARRSSPSDGWHRMLSRYSSKRSSVDAWSGWSGRYRSSSGHKSASESTSSPFRSSGSKSGSKSGSTSKSKYRSSRSSSHHSSHFMSHFLGG